MGSSVKDSSSLSDQMFSNVVFARKTAGRCRLQSAYLHQISPARVKVHPGEKSTLEVRMGLVWTCSCAPAPVCFHTLPPSDWSIPDKPSPLIGRKLGFNRQQLLRAQVCFQLVSTSAICVNCDSFLSLSFILVPSCHLLPIKFWMNKKIFLLPKDII